MVIIVIIVIHGYNMKCPRCEIELSSIACHEKCLRCGYSFDCSDM